MTALFSAFSSGFGSILPAWSDVVFVAAFVGSLVVGVTKNLLDWNEALTWFFGTAGICSLVCVAASDWQLAGDVCGFALFFLLCKLDAKRHSKWDCPVPGQVKAHPRLETNDLRIDIDDPFAFPESMQPKQPPISKVKLGNQPELRDLD